MSSSDAPRAARSSIDLGKRQDAPARRAAEGRANGRGVDGRGATKGASAKGAPGTGAAQGASGTGASRGASGTGAAQGAPAKGTPGTATLAPGTAARGVASSAQQRPPAHPDRDVRRARLVVARVDPWSVMKLGFLLSIAMAVVALTAVFVLWTVLDSMGVWQSVSDTIGEVTKSETTSGFQLMTYVGLSRVMGVSAILACVNIVLMTALATLGAFLYNLAASLVGGLHVTLSEDA